MTTRVKVFFFFLLASPVFSASAQDQACPLNINFSTGDLTHWFAYTGNNRNGNGPQAIQLKYDSTSPAPTGTIGNRSILEYNLGAIGIFVNTLNSVDIFGGFNTVPVINGYAYNYSIKIGSTNVSHGNGGGGNSPAGGYIRGISYRINVPAGSTGDPYTMTYAYAMVLENGTHNSNEQPFISATLTSDDSIIQCASPAYYLPTFNNTGSGERGATLDTARAKANGFKLSPQLSPNENQTQNGGPAHLQDVWTKAWTEVTFDLSAFRGKQVVLTFEADNCIPGGHFAYAYIAIRNKCAGLDISGDSLVCSNTSRTYSVPALAGADYSWTLPPGWTFVSGQNTNVIQVKSGVNPGNIIAHEVNGCADLADTIQIKTTPPSVGGMLTGNNEVCAGINFSPIQLSGYVGNITGWVSSPDGIQWSPFTNTNPAFNAQNLEGTTAYRALVQNNGGCDIDSSSTVLITVDPKSNGGTMLPPNTDICKGQTTGVVLTLNNHIGTILNWQSSPNGNGWNNFIPPGNDTVYNVSNINSSLSYRAIAKSGVCPADTSSVAFVKYYDILYPSALIQPADTLICYGGVASLHAVVSNGTQYQWSNTNTLNDQGNGHLFSSPANLNATANPQFSTDYILSVQNAGCPNLLRDTFHIQVNPQIKINAGNDTTVVINQPLQFSASSPDSLAYSWSPATGLSDVNIPDPLGNYNVTNDVIHYLVKGTAVNGCSGTDDIVVRVFKTLPDIFVPNAFTPGRATNNLFRPIAVGIATMQYFRVYNRWGELVFNSAGGSAGWDGTLGGKTQSPGGYVWMAQGIDYTGRTITRKGVMVLIR